MNDVVNEYTTDGVRRLSDAITNYALDMMTENERCRYYTALAQSKRWVKGLETLYPAILPRTDTERETYNVLFGDGSSVRG